MKKIILGSASPRRKELLSQIGVPFEVRVSNKEEVYTNTVPKEIVKELALMKAENVASEIQARNVIVIGADTIVVHEEQILGKPKDEQEAFEMIRSLQGDTHQVYTGVAVLDFDENGEKTVISHAVETKVSVNPMSTEEIQKYIESKEPMDKAGAYGIQGRFSAFIEKIEGDYFNVVGLPVSYVYQVLKELGRYKMRGRKTAANCESCMNYEYDDDYECYVCTQDLDEDEMVRFVQGDFRECPYYQVGDEYRVVRKQM